MPTPEGAQPVDECGADGNFARFAPFGVVDAQNVAAAIDVFGADVQCLAHAHSAVINEGEVGFVAVVAEGPQQLGNLLAGEDVWQWFLA